MTACAPLLEVKDLRVEYQRDGHAGVLRAVDGVSFVVGPAETLGIVGESGSGKSTLARAILGLVPRAGGSVILAGRSIENPRRSERREVSSLIQVVFQDPYGSLNPVRTIGQSMEEMLRPHGAGREAARTRAAALLQRVGLPADAVERYPSRFSGGQRQRIAIARALMANSKLVICDEPVSSLDLSVQAQVLNLLRELQGELGISYVFVSHDLAVVRHMSHRIVVLYKGRVMESGSASDIYERPLHPYTTLLVDAAPIPDPERQHARRSQHASSVRSSATPGQNACPFASRCEFATELCWRKRPELEPTPDGTDVACHHWADIARSRD
jgi:oligopeptide/dipeptide ABC transporter ATP-binding protein